VIALGLRLTLKGGREAGVRLVFTAFGVAVAVALLLLLLAGFNGLSAQDARAGWLSTGGHNLQPSVNEAASTAIVWGLSGDLFGTSQIIRIDVAATGSRSPLPPGISRLPGPGEYYTSPALARLIASTPAAQLAGRYPGRRIGVIGNAGLTAPDALIAIVGHGPAELRSWGYIGSVRSIESAPRQHSYSNFMRVILGIGAIGLMIPILIFVATATRLAAARREERFAALRLVGATPAQVGVIASVEAGVAAVVGTAVGFGMFWAIRPLVALIPFTGDRFFTADLSLGWLATAGVALGVPIAAALASLLSLRRVVISPLGVSRRVTPRPPRARRLIVLLAGLLVLGSLGLLARRAGGAYLYVILASFGLMTVGLIVAGPWLTMIGARLLSRVARRDATLIAARRMADDPARAFRSISGLILAVFVGSVFIGIAGTAFAINDSLGRNVLADSTLTARFDSIGVAAPGADSDGVVRRWIPDRGLTPAAAAPLVRRLAGIPGVGAVVPARALPVSPPATDQPATDQPPAWMGQSLVSGKDWARLAAFGPVVGTGPVVQVPVDEVSNGRTGTQDWPAQAAPRGGLTRLPLAALVVTTDGRASTIESVRTAIEAVAPQILPESIGERQTSQAGLVRIRMLRRMTDVGIILSLIIAGCSLAVSVSGGLIERKRAFGMLRLSGMPLSRLRRVVLLEAVVPLILVALLSGGAGLLVADLVLRTVNGQSGIVAPGIGYYAVMLGGLAGAIAVVGATLPLLKRLTEPAGLRIE
jgi:hypothetical protein